MDIEKELKDQKKMIKDIQSDIKKIKKFYFTSLIIKLLIIFVPLIGLILSIPWLIDLYENITNISI